MRGEIKEGERKGRGRNKERKGKERIEDDRR